MGVQALALLNHTWVHLPARGTPIACPGQVARHTEPPVRSTNQPPHEERGDRAPTIAVLEPSMRPSGYAWKRNSWRVHSTRMHVPERSRLPLALPIGISIGTVTGRCPGGVLQYGVAA